MTVKEKLKLQVSIYKDLKRQNERDYYHYCNISDDWARESEAASKARAAVYDLVADKLEEILKEWNEEEGDDRK